MPLSYPSVEITEGTWIPTLGATTTPGAHGYTSERLGWWDRIGNRVFLHWCMTINVKDTTISGDILLTGLPFRLRDSFGYLAGASLSSYNGFNMPTGFEQVGLQGTRNNNHLNVIFSGKSGIILCNQSHLNTGITLRGNITYQVN